MNRALNFYKTQGIRTNVQEGSFSCFPDDISSICEILRGIGIHPCDLEEYNLDLSQERVNDRYLKTVQEALDKVIALKNDPLINSREPKDKIVIVCRHFAMLLVSVLRSKGIPARCRCGFATYFSNGWLEDHWICEYWNEKEERWLRVDSQIHKIKSNIKQIALIDPTDMPKDIFFPAGVIWRLYRQGFISGEYCGFSHMNSQTGAWYIRGNMLRDFFALNKVEYDYLELSKLMDGNYTPSEKELLLLDQIADLTVTADDNFDEIIDFYKKNRSLAPKVV